MNTCTVEEYLAKFRLREMSIERSVMLWLKKEKRKAPKLDQKIDERIAERVRSKKLADVRKQELSAVRAQRLKLARERHDEELRLEAAGLAPDGRPYVVDPTPPPPLQRFLQAGPRGIQ